MTSKPSPLEQEIADRIKFLALLGLEDTKPTPSFSNWKEEVVGYIMQAIEKEKNRVIDKLVEKAQVKCMTMEVGSINLSDLEDIAEGMKK